MPETTICLWIISLPGAQFWNCCFTFFFFFSFIFISWRLITLQYCSGFVIHWHESAMDLHVFPIPILPPTSLSTQPLVALLLMCFCLFNYIKQILEETVSLNPLGLRQYPSVSPEEESGEEEEEVSVSLTPATVSSHFLLLAVFCSSLEWRWGSSLYNCVWHIIQVQWKCFR